MRILAINWQDLSHPLAGGAEVHLEEILQRVVQWGHEVTLACSSYSGAASRQSINGFRVVRRGGRHNFNFVAPFLVKNLLDEQKYDLIVEDINKIPFYLPAFYKLPHLAVIPHLFGKNIYQETNPIVASYVYLAEQPIPAIYSDSHFLAISDSTREDLVGRGIRRDRIAVAECGVDHNVYFPKLDLPRFEQPTVVYLGRLKKYKSVQHLIAAMPMLRRRIPNARLMIVGGGDYADALRAQTARLGLIDAVEFTGYVALERKIEILRRAHISVYPSPKEGWGITNIEANACGTPVVAANVPGLKDSVSDGVSGLLYDYANVDQLAERLAQMLADNELHQRLCQGAIGWAARFTWDNCARLSFAAMERTVAEWGTHG